MGIVLVTTVTIALVVVVYLVLPVGSLLTAPLENRFPRPSALPDMLMALLCWEARSTPLSPCAGAFPSLNSDAERMTEFARLAKLYQMPGWFSSGGSGLLSASSSDFKEADVARLFFTQQGLIPTHIVFEDRSRNTYENVVFSKAIVKPQPGQIWLLVSTAQDLPRAMGIFRKLDWSITPVPVAYKSDTPHNYSLSENLRETDRAVHEWLGAFGVSRDGKDRCPCSRRPHRRMGWPPLASRPVLV